MPLLVFWAERAFLATNLEPSNGGVQPTDRICRSRLPRKSEPGLIAQGGMVTIVRCGSENERFTNGEALISVTLSLWSMECDIG
jgi:hypothetical protein